MKKCLYLLIALMVFTATAWAQEVHVSTEAELNARIADQPSGTTIIVDANISLQNVLIFDNDIILDLNGRTLTVNNQIRVRSTPSGTSSIPRSLQIYDNSTSGQGIIKGRYLGNDGGAIYVESGNALDIFSGTIQVDRNSNYNGGAIYNAGTFIMYGGTITGITGGSAANGGAVYNAGTMTLAGGSIEKCTASTDGGAIYNTGTLTINRGTIGGIDETDPDNPEPLGNTASSHGGAIYNGGTLTVNGGVISYNSGNDAGAIYNESGKTLTIKGGSFSNNASTTYSGGAVVNEGTATIEGGSFSNNTAQVNGGGIYNHGSLTVTGGSITGNTATTGNGGGIYIHETGGNLTMSGRPVVMGNLGSNTNNLYLGQNKVITIGGAFTTGATVGVRTYNNNTDAFTSGYGTNSPDNLSVFTSDNLNYSVTIDNNGEAKLVGYSAPTIPEDAIPYLNVDATGDHGTAYCSTYTKMSDVDASNPVLSNGWYVVDQNLTFNKRISIASNCDVNLILMDNTTLTANNGVFVSAGTSLHIWGQSTRPLSDPNPMGQLHAYSNTTNYSGLGGRRVAGEDESATTDAGGIIIHGGFIAASGGQYASGILTTSVIGAGQYSLRIFGGQVIAVGGKYGAGIGGNYATICGGIQITGGIVSGIGGVDAAGIGSGRYGMMYTLGSGYSTNPSEDVDVTEIRITGGYVTGWGNFGAGIGGGHGADEWGGNTYDGGPAKVYIDGGTVYAYTTDATSINNGGAVAIGWGFLGMDGYNFVHIHDNAKVTASTTTNSADETLQTAADGRGNNYRRFKRMLIEPCNHPGHNNPINYTDNGSSLSVNCDYCYTKEPYTFIHNNNSGNWDYNGNWLGGIMPGAGKNVAIAAAAHIHQTCTAYVGKIDIKQGGSLTVDDGGQLIHNGPVYATVKKHIIGHFGDNDSGWNFIATPIAAGTTVSTANGIENGEHPEEYDLYYYDEPTHYWKNHKAHTIQFLNYGQGYLYASYYAAPLTFEGVLQPGDCDINGTYTYTVQGLSHSATELTGYNLVGNPFACNATIDRPAYVISGTHVVAYEGNQFVLPPCEGVMVQADAEHESVTFTKVIPATQGAPANPTGSLQIALSQPVPEPVEGPDRNQVGVSTGSTTLALDNAIVSFKEGSELGKFYFGEQSANIYIPQGGEEYAIAFSDKQGEMPLNFKATEDGTYTLTVSPEGVEMAYLHLIDNMTGADIDLLHHNAVIAGEDPQSPTPSYTFTAKTTDYESRFKLVFSANDADGPSTGSGVFAFISDGNIIVNGNGTLQIIDVTGRIVVQGDAINRVSTSGMTAGVYVLRLINGNDVKTQKIVVR